MLAAAGVNRISLALSRSSRSSCWSSNVITASLKWSGALEIVKPRFDRWSLDLIFGIPGSTVVDWENDLEIALTFGPSATSRANELGVFEKGTELWNHRQHRPRSKRSIEEFNGSCSKRPWTAWRRLGCECTRFQTSLVAATMQAQFGLLDQ